MILNVFRYNYIVLYLKIYKAPLTVLQNSDVQYNTTEHLYLALTKTSLVLERVMLQS